MTEAPIVGSTSWKLAEAAQLIARLEIDNGRLKSAIRLILDRPWLSISIDKDSVEYQITVSCYDRDALLAAMEPIRELD